VQPGAAVGRDPGIRAVRKILGATSQETPEGRVDAVKVGTTVLGWHGAYAAGYGTPSNRPRAREAGGAAIGGDPLSSWLASPATRTRSAIWIRVDACGVVKGPALIVEPNSTLVLEPGWQVRRLAGGELMLEADTEGASRGAQPGVDAATLPARIEILNNLFMHIAEQMGEVLKSTAQKVTTRAAMAASGGLSSAHRFWGPYSQTTVELRRLGWLGHGRSCRRRETIACDGGNGGNRRHGEF
jgi:hypothetical protein